MHYNSRMYGTANCNHIRTYNYITSYIAIQGISVDSFHWPAAASRTSHHFRFFQYHKHTCIGVEGGGWWVVGFVCFTNFYSGIGGTN